MIAEQSEYKELLKSLREIALLGSCSSVLGWDEQTHMPAKGAELRAEQSSLLAGVIHDRVTDPRIGELLGALETEIGDGAASHERSPEEANVRETRRSYDRATKLPKSLVEEMTKTTSLSQQAWVEARAARDYSSFQPWLEKVVELKRREAECLSTDGAPLYDALLDDYEPGATSELVASVFDPLREELVKLVGEIRDCGRGPDPSILTRSYPVDVQSEVSQEAAALIGFDFDAGRLDIAAHPFCSGFGPGDCRLTTRYDEHHFPGAFFGTLHEAGHGMYEQGLRQDLFGSPMGQSASLGIHESQSRLWENMVGRSRAFWDHMYSNVQSRFSTALGDVSLESFHAAINDVRPSLIRVEADEVTYNLHIMLRFELERRLISGDLQVQDVPAAWNEAYESYLGLTPPDDAVGCMQDIHWSCGFLGYFPTYALGNMYAAQLYTAAEKDLGSLDEQFAAGHFGPLKTWLNENIHARGKQFLAPDLIRNVTGGELSHEPLVQHLRSRFEPLYGLGS